MTDLSHWDFAENFDGYDAAALILGLEPRQSEDEQGRVNVVLERLELHYTYARERLISEVACTPEFAPLSDAEQRHDLQSVEMKKQFHLSKSIGSDCSFFLEWLTNNRAAGFNRQEFSRQDISKWIMVIGMPTKYSFDRSNSEITASHPKWPWGNHHTTALGHLEAAARKYWINYDPLDNTSAETNVRVSEWLQSERKASKIMADSIASMLRPDGLPPGPRK